MPRGRGLSGPPRSMLLEGPANPHRALCARGLSWVPWPGLACRLVESSKWPSFPNACCPGLVLGAPPSSGVSLALGSLSLSTPTLGLQCSKSCGSGIRRRQVVCTIGPPGRCVDLQSSKPAEVEACNRQPCHLPQGKDQAGRVAAPHPLAAPGCFPTSLAIAAPAVANPYADPCGVKLTQCRFRCHRYIMPHAVTSFLRARCMAPFPLYALPQCTYYVGGRYSATVEWLNEWRENECLSACLPSTSPPSL